MRWPVKVSADTIAWFAFTCYAGISIFLPFTDGDSPHYGYMARLVSEGQIPLRDFFSAQMDGFLYIYGLWFKLFGASFISAKSFYLTLITLLILLYIRFVKYALGLSGWIVVFSFLTLPYLTFPYGGVNHHILTAVFCNFSVIAFFIAVIKPPVPLSKGSESVLLFLSGLFLGAAVACRLPFAALFPLMAFMLIVIGRADGWGALLRRLVVFSTGFFIPGLLALYEMGRFGIDYFIFVKIKHRAVCYMEMRARWQIGDLATMFAVNYWFFHAAYAIVIAPAFIKWRRREALDAAEAFILYSAVIFYFMVGVYELAGFFRGWYLVPLFPFWIFAGAALYKRWADTSRRKWVVWGLAAVYCFNALPIHKLCSKDIRFVYVQPHPSFEPISKSILMAARWYEARTGRRPLPLPFEKNIPHVYALEYARRFMARNDLSPQTALIYDNLSIIPFETGTDIPPHWGAMNSPQMVLMNISDAALAQVGYTREQLEKYLIPQPKEFDAYIADRKLDYVVYYHSIDATTEAKLIKAGYEIPEDFDKGKGVYFYSRPGLR